MPYTLRIIKDEVERVVPKISEINLKTRLPPPSPYRVPKASAVLLYHSYVAFASENLELLKNIKTQNLPIDLGKPKVYDVIT